MNDILRQLNLLDNKNSLLNNLTKPPKETNKTMPHTEAFQKYAVEQADLLHLPDDDGFRYLLVVVDISTRLCDAEPLKSKEAKEVKTALQKIFKRKYIKKPTDSLEVDDGSEFKGVFKSFFNKMFDIVSKIPGRHRQQAVVEAKNYIIGTILNKRMLAEEINNNSSSHSWVDIVPKVVQLINQKFSHPPTVPNPFAPERVNNMTRHILVIGTKVRNSLDNPKDYVSDKKLHGRFRAGDIRWDKNIKTITRFFLRPGQPPMYQLDNDDRVAYTREQLQLVSTNEAKPPTTGQKKWNIKKLLKRYKKGNKIMFQVLWEDGSKTDEPRTNLIKDIPDLVKAFELKGQE